MFARALQRSDATTGIAIDRLQAGTVIVVNTQNSQYRLVILLEPRVVLVTGGSMFPDPTVVRLASSAAGGGGDKRAWILVGSHMQMWLGSVLITSSPVESISLETVPARTRSGSPRWH